VVDPLTATKIWLLVKPYKRFKHWNQNRKQRKGKGMAIDTGLRTSTNTVVGAPILGTIYVNLVQLLPYKELVAALTTPESVVLVTSLLAWGVARWSKTPADPGKL
jgi:hypothetical protein